MYTIFIFNEIHMAALEALGQMWIQQLCDSMELVCTSQTCMCLMHSQTVPMLLN